MRLTAILRRARRLGISAFTLPFQRPKQPAKHIKIDDEERLEDEDPSSFYTSSRVARIRAHVRRMKMLLFILLALLVFLALIVYIIYKPPKSIINYLQRKYPDVLFQVDISSSQRIIALTLDDAPSAETAKILDLLKFYGAKATFFIIGSQVSGHENLLRRMHDEGHEIANHAWVDEPSFQLPLSELERQIKEVEKVIPANTGGARYFRPGSGFFNKKMVERVKLLGYRTVLGGIYPHDPQIPNAKWNAKHVLSMLRPGGIIIMHDRRSYSVDQLELVLKGLTSGGWNVETLSGLLRAGDEPRRGKSE